VVILDYPALKSDISLQAILHGISTAKSCQKEKSLWQNTTGHDVGDLHTKTGTDAEKACENSQFQGFLSKAKNWYSFCVCYL
jgi:hypothetical protein